MKTSNIQLVYNADVAARIRCRGGEFSQTDIARVLDTLLAGTQLTYEVKDGIYTIVRRTRQSSQRAEVGTVSGIVVDENREPVIGASVLVKGTTKGVITDLDGRFALRNVSGREVVLIIRYIGKKDIETRVKLNSENEFVMKEDVNVMSEVVVTGYQDISREKVTGSVSTVSAEKLEDRYMPSLMDNLEGRVAGLTTYGDKTTIRGTSSLYASTNPLLVVDGLPIEGSIDGQPHRVGKEKHGLCRQLLYDARTAGADRKRLLRLVLFRRRSRRPGFDDRTSHQHRNGCRQSHKLCLLPTI